MKQFLILISILFLANCQQKEVIAPIKSGEVIFYTNISNLGNIKLYINGNLEGTITKYTSGNAPKCGLQGYVTISRLDGAYKFSAISDTGTEWDGIINVRGGICKSQKLVSN